MKIDDIEYYSLLEVLESMKKNAYERSIQPFLDDEEIAYLHGFEDGIGECILKVKYSNAIKQQEEL
jgi:hypothetical protein